jgi:hypothetical protein
MAHLLAAARDMRMSVEIYWPPAVIGLGLVATLAWTAFLGYVAVGLVESSTH